MFTPELDKIQKRLEGIDWDLMPFSQRVRILRNMFDDNRHEDRMKIPLRKSTEK